MILIENVLFYADGGGDPSKRVHIDFAGSRFGYTLAKNIKKFTNINEYKKSGNYSKKYLYDDFFRYRNSALERGQRPVDYNSKRRAFFFADDSLLRVKEGLLSADPIEKYYATKALATRSEEDAIRLISKILLDNNVDPVIRFEAGISLLHQYNNHKLTTEQLEMILRSLNDLGHESKKISVLVSFSIDKITTIDKKKRIKIMRLFKQFLNDSDKRISRIAATHLQKFNVGDDLDKLIMETIYKSDDPLTSLYASDALYKITDESKLDEILRLKEVSQKNWSKKKKKIWKQIRRKAFDEAREKAQLHGTEDIFLRKYLSDSDITIRLKSMKGTMQKCLFNMRKKLGTRN